MAGFVGSCSDLMGPTGLMTYAELQAIGRQINFLTWRSFEESYNEMLQQITDTGIKNKYGNFREFMVKNKGTSAYRKLLQKSAPPPKESKTFKR